MSLRRQLWARIQGWNSCVWARGLAGLREPQVLGPAKGAQPSNTKCAYDRFASSKFGRWHGPPTTRFANGLIPTGLLKRELSGCQGVRARDLFLDSDGKEKQEGEADRPPTDKEQEELLLHFCIGLRKALVASQPLLAATLLPILKALRDATPKGFTSYAATFMDYAFWQEMEHIAEAAQLSEQGAKVAHEELVAVCVSAAEAGLVHMNTPIALSRHYKVKLPARCEDPASVHASLPWKVFLVGGFKEKLVRALQDLQVHGFAVVDDVLGEELFATVSKEVSHICENHDESFTDGQLSVGDASKTIRDDRIAWLTGVEQMESSPLVSSAAQLLRTRALGIIASLKPEYHLMLPDEYLSRVMLAIYPRNSHGFVRHTDNQQGWSNDKRYLSVVYYVGNQQTWDAAWGGQLNLFPNSAENDSGTVSIDPVGDRLVLFKSSLEHEVSATSHDCPRRVALSAWYLRTSSQ
mmetsp:Transcript_10604/g.38979  ORF Transcript_10604/g.38979 Transcript_10604/m.38979 type:complete len:466 (+) Transcript_10604:36-1433(+)